MKKRALIVVHDEELGKKWNRLLSVGNSFEVKTVFTGKDGWNSLQQDSGFDLVVVTIQTKPTGLEILTHALNEGCKGELLLVTEDRPDQRMLNMAAAFRVNKVFSQSDVRAVLVKMAMEAAMEPATA